MNYNFTYILILILLFRYGSITDGFDYITPSGPSIQIKSTVRDLGILFDNKLMFHHHIAKTVAKANQMAGWTLRVFKSRSTLVLRTLLKTLVIPHLEYGCVIWSPTDVRHINMLENVQRRFTSRFSCFQEYSDALQTTICSHDYVQRLKKLKLYSMQRRRERYIILYMVKIIYELVPNPGFVYSYNDRTLLKVTPKSASRGPSWVKKAIEASFFRQGPLLFNKLPRNMRDFHNTPTPDSKTLARFKSKLDRHLATIADHPGNAHNSLLTAQ